MRRKETRGVVKGQFQTDSWFSQLRANSQQETSSGRYFCKMKILKKSKLQEVKSAA